MIPRYQFAGLESSQLDDAPKSWCPVRLGIPGPPVCRTGAHDPSELTGQILVRAARLELALRGLRGRYSATRIPPAWSQH